MAACPGVGSNVYDRFANLDKFAWMGTFSDSVLRGGNSLETAFNGLFKDVEASTNK
jgi:hypothetical protein